MRVYIFLLSLLFSLHIFGDTPPARSINAELYDASGNAINSTSNAINSYLTNSSIAVSQSSTPWLVDTTKFGGNNIVTGTGASGLGIPRFTISNDSNILATQSGTWNLTNISGTVSLPTGASTSALQTTGNTSLGNIDTNTSNTNTSVQNVQGPVAPGTVASKSELIGGQYNSTLPTLTNGQQAALQLDSSGRLMTNSANGSQLATGTLGTLGATVAVSGVNYQSYTILITGSWSGGIVLEKSVDGTNWITIPAYDASAGYVYQTVLSNNTITASGGTNYFRVRMALYTSGTANIFIEASQGNPVVEVVQPSGASLQTVTKIQDSSGNAIYNGQNTMANSLPVTIASNQTNIPTNTTQFGGTNVSTGTGASGAGIPRVTVANDSKVQVWDGTNTATVKAASTAAAATDTSQVVALSPNSSIPVGNNYIGKVKLNGSGSQEEFGTLVTSSRKNQFEVHFFDSSYLTEVAQTLTGTGTVTTSGGAGLLSSGTGTTSSVTLQTHSTIRYNVGSEIYSLFTVAFTTPTSTSTYERIGNYNTSDGIFVQYAATAGSPFQVCYRKATVDTCTSKASFNIDTLTGAAGSLYTNAGVPVAIDLTKTNLYRIRYGWLGIGSIQFEVMSPDGEWVVFHIYRTPNSLVGTHIQTPILPLTAEVVKSSADSQNVVMTTNAWASGTAATVTNEEIFDFSSTNLTASSSYTTPWFDTRQGTSFLVSVAADQPITYQIQYSPDQIIVKTTDSATVAANKNYSSTYISEAKFFRIIYTNSGASTTTSVFLSTAQNSFDQPYAHRLQDAVGNEMTFRAANGANISTDYTIPVTSYASDGAKATYSAGFTYGAPNTPTDTVVFVGSATKTIRITRIEISGTQTTAAMRDVLFIRRSAADTGGTSTLATAVPHDINSAAATSSPRFYTANPTALGTAVGTMKAVKVYVPTTITQANNIFFDFGNRPEQAIVLRGASDVFAINLNSITSTGDNWDMSITWTEEP